jgi:hypothetical protein
MSDPDRFKKRQLSMIPSSAESTEGLKYTSGVYTLAELEFFFKHSQYSNRPIIINKVKREYALVRLLLSDKTDINFLKKIHGWLMLCELFPLRISWILTLSVVVFNPCWPHLHHLQKVNLLEFYRKYVDEFVMDTFPGDTATQIDNPELVAHYRDLFVLDEDEVCFQNFLMELNMTVEDIGHVTMNNPGSCRDMNTVSSYSFNLYPPVLTCVKEVRSYLCVKRRLTEVFTRGMPQEAAMDPVVPGRMWKERETSTSCDVVMAGAAPNLPDTPNVLGAVVRDSYDMFQIQTGGEVRPVNSVGTRARADVFYRTVLRDFDNSVEAEGVRLPLSDYARALAQLVVYGAESAPKVIGIYCEDDVDARTFMQRLGVQIRLHGLMAILDAHPGGGPGSAVRKEVCDFFSCDDFDELESSVDIFYKWLCAHGPAEALSVSSWPLSLLSRFRRRHMPRIFPAESPSKRVEETTAGGKGDPITATADESFVSIDVGVVNKHRGDAQAINWPLGNMLKQKVTPDLRVANLLRFHRDWWKVGVEKASSEDDVGFDGCYDYEVVLLDSWSLNSGDILWSTIIDALYEAVSRHFGPKYTNAERNAKRWAERVMLLLGIALAVIAIVVSKENLTDTYGSYTATIDTVIGYATAAGSAYTLIYSQYATYIQQSPTDQTFSSISKTYKDRLGYMRAVMSSLEIVSGFLENPVAPVTFIDFLLPSAVADAVKRCTRSLQGSGVRTHRPCKMVIIVNGLQQCSPDKIAETIEALTLLSNLPSFIVIFGTNPSVLQRSSSLKETYEKLSHWVDVPFKIPEPSAGEKNREALLTADSRRG